MSSRGESRQRLEFEMQADADEARRQRRQKFIEARDWYVANKGEKIDGRSIWSLRNTNADFELLMLAITLPGDTRKVVPKPSVLPPEDEFSKLDRHQLVGRLRRKGRSPRAGVSDDVLRQQLRRLVAAEALDQDHKRQTPVSV